MALVGKPYMLGHINKETMNRVIPPQKNCFNGGSDLAAWLGTRSKNHSEMTNGLIRDHLSSHSYLTGHSSEVQSPKI